MTQLTNEIEALFSKLPEDNTKKRYRLVNERGEYYTMHYGWQKKSGKLYGHIYSKEQATLLKKWLESQGEKSITIKHDLIGTLFMTVI